MGVCLTLFSLAHLTSLPTVMDAITFFTASFFFSFLSLFSSALSSKISPAHKRKKKGITHHVIHLWCRGWKWGTCSIALFSQITTCRLESGCTCIQCTAFPYLSKSLINTEWGHWHAQQFLILVGGTGCQGLGLGAHTTSNHLDHDSCCTS